MAKKRTKNELTAGQAEKLAQKIWRAGLGVYGAAHDVSGHKTDDAFEALAKRGKAFEKATAKRSGKRKPHAKLARQLATIGAQIQALRPHGPKAKKAGKGMDRAALLKALGLNEIVDTRPAVEAGVKARLEALEEMVAALGAEGKLTDAELQARVRRMGEELVTLSGPEPKPALDEQGRLETPQGQADDLKRIKGIGPVLERKLNEAGIFHFWQIAALNDQQTETLEGDMSFPGRIRRDDWRAQADALSQGSLL
jgi:predicted flap endonuclease-1-like 5' DNA nuclease